MKIFIQGKVLGRFESEFNNKDKGLVKTKKVQFMETLENGKVVVTEIKLNEEQSIKELVSGVNVQMSVKLYTPKDKNLIYYSQDGELKILNK